MQLAPRHHGPRIVVDHGPVGAPAALVIAQRRRFEAAVRALPDDAWRAPTRCVTWSVRDVVAHLVTVNGYWAASARAARRGAPLRVLAGFDPAATPDALVASLAGVTDAELVDRLGASHDVLADALADVDDPTWDLDAETPVGHVALRTMAAHALWDSWVHERDVFVPLGLAAAPVPAEVALALRYAVTLGAAFVALHRIAPSTALAIDAASPALQLTVDLVAVDGIDTVEVRDAPAGPRPCLRGDATTLLEALSLRAPLPADAPAAWHERRAAVARAIASPPDPLPDSSRRHA